MNTEICGGLRFLSMRKSSSLFLAVWVPCPPVRTTKALIELKNVSVALDGQTVLRRINWRLCPREHWAVLGGNGAGKTTFLKLVRGELWPAPNGKGRRFYAFDEERQTTAIGIKEKIALVSPELQERYLQQEWRLTARQVTQSGFLATDYVQQRPTADQQRRVETVGRLLGLAPLWTRNVQELSTGELRRVLIARALVGKPAVLVCDEICDGLDADSRVSLLRALDQVARKGTQLLFTTHRGEELVSAITHVLVLRKGRIVAQGRKKEVLEDDESLTLTPRNGRNADGASLTARDSRGRAVRAPMKPLIRLQRANVYLNGRRVLWEIDWEMLARQHWAVVGANGAGKTTFLKLVAGDIHPALGGRVTRFDLTSKSSLWDIRRRIGWVSPEFQANYREPLTGAEVIASGFFSSVGLMGRIKPVQRVRVRGLMLQLGIESLAQRDARKLSYGEFRKLLLARALVHYPEVLICDEPFDGLDAPSRASMKRFLERVAGNGTNLIVVTHHSDDLPECMTHVLRLEAGSIVAQGPLR